MAYKTIDEYIEHAPDDVRSILEKMRQTIRKVVPDATEAMGYGIPTFDLNGKHLVHFAAFKKHIGFYPTPGAIMAFKEDLADYKTAEGTIQFPLDQPIPYALVRKITAYRVKEVKAQAKTKATPRRSNRGGQS